MENRVGVSVPPITFTTDGVVVHPDSRPPSPRTPPRVRAGWGPGAVSAPARRPDGRLRGSSRREVTRPPCRPGRGDHDRRGARHPGGRSIPTGAVAVHLTSPRARPAAASPSCPPHIATGWRLAGMVSTRPRPSCHSRPPHVVRTLALHRRTVTAAGALVSSPACTPGRSEQHRSGSPPRCISRALRGRRDVAEPVGKATPST